MYFKASNSSNTERYEFQLVHEQWYFPLWLNRWKVEFQVTFVCGILREKNRTRKMSFVGGILCYEYGSTCWESGSFTLCDFVWLRLRFFLSLQMSCTGLNGSVLTMWLWRHHNSHVDHYKQQTNRSRNQNKKTQCEFALSAIFAAAQFKLQKCLFTKRYIHILA